MYKTRSFHFLAPTGRWTDKTNFYIVGGVAGIIGGGLLSMTGGGKSMRA